MLVRTIAVISPSDRDFRNYKLQQSQTEPNVNYVHVSSLNECEGLSINDYVSITNKAKMPNLNIIESELIKIISKNGYKETEFIAKVISELKKYPFLKWQNKKTSNLVSRLFKEGYRTDETVGFVILNN